MVSKHIERIEMVMGVGSWYMSEEIFHHLLLFHWLCIQPFFQKPAQGFPNTGWGSLKLFICMKQCRRALVAGKDELQKIMNLRFYTLAMLFSFFSFGRFCKILHRRKLKQLQCHLWTWWCLLKSFSYSYEILIKWIPDHILIILRGKSISSAWLHFAGEENRQNYVRGPY